MSFYDDFSSLLFLQTKALAIFKKIPNLQFERISQQKIAMSPDISVCTTFVTSFMLDEKCDVVSSHTSKRVKKSLFQKNDIVTSYLE